MKSYMILISSLLFVLILFPMSYAGEADIIQVEVKETADRIYRFDVTVRHNDTGWEHYANKWEVVAPDGRVLGVRTLLHPHVNEQPFTRSLSGVKIPDGIDIVIIRAHDLVHEYGGKEIRVNLPK